MDELLIQWRIYQKVIPLHYHSFEHFMAWLEKEYWDKNKPIELQNPKPKKSKVIELISYGDV